MLNKKEILRLIETHRLLEGYIDCAVQATPNGFDLTAGSLYAFDGAGAIDFSNTERQLPPCKELVPIKKNSSGSHDWWNLSLGCYKVKTNETINMPQTLTALASTRTTLLRMGVSTSNGVWDAGFCGKSEFLLIVHNPAGVWLQRNARVIQLVFLPVGETEAYAGIYKHLE